MKRPREAEPDEMMRARHDLVMKMRIQEAFQAGGAIGPAAFGKSGIGEVAPVSVDDGKIAQDFAGWKGEGGAKFIGAKLEAKVLRLAAADGALGFVRIGIEAAAFLVFVNGTAEKIRQALRQL